MFGILLLMSVGCGGGVFGAERRERLLALARESDRIALEFSLVAAGFAETDECEEDGFESPIAWIKANCHMSGGAAADRICAGEQLDRLDRSEAAVLAGEIGFAHFAHIAKVSAAVGERLDETTLLRHAGKESVAKFRETCIHARHAADPRVVVDEEANGVEARYLTITNSDDGLVAVSGTLDKVGGAALRTALEPLAKRMGKDDHRLFPRRLADALVDLSMHSLDNGKPSSRPNLQVTASLETLLGLAGAPAAEMEFSLPISAKAVERLACDCSVTRILLGSESTVIDVGRARRVVSGPQSKALKGRGFGCVWPGCGRPGRWTSAHHLVHWIRNGSTDPPNRTLLCYRHPRMVHEGDWQIVRPDVGSILTIPPITSFQQPPRGPD